MNLKSRGVRAAVAAAGVSAAAATALALAPTGTAAAAGFSVTASNSDVNAQCAVNTETVNGSGQTVYYLSSQAYPNNPIGLLNNKYSQVDCSIQDQDGTVLASFSRSTNASVLLQTRNSGQVLTATSFKVCARGVVKLTTNVVSDTGTVCSAG